MNEQTPTAGFDLAPLVQSVTEAYEALSKAYGQVLPKLLAGLAPDPAPSGVDSLCLRIAAAITKAGTGEAMRGVFDAIEFAAVPSDLADAVITEVVGPELARRDAEIERVAEAMRAAREKRDAGVDRNIGVWQAQIAKRDAGNAQLRAERDQLADENKAIPLWRDRYFAMAGERDRLSAENKRLLQLAQDLNDKWYLTTRAEVDRLRTENEQLRQAVVPVSEFRQANSIKVPAVQPRVWQAGDPEPTDDVVVRDCQGDLWTKGTGDLWESPETQPFPWAYITRKWGPLTEVIAVATNRGEAT